MEWKPDLRKVKVWGTKEGGKLREYKDKCVERSSEKTRSILDPQWAELPEVTGVLSILMPVCEFKSEAENRLDRASKIVALSIS